jgi:hypothetical protein
MIRRSGFVILLACMLMAMACKYTASFPIDQPAKLKIDPRLLGIWKMQEDTSCSNYFVVEQKDDYHYKATYINKNGDNAVYSHFPIHYSEIEGSGFLNVSYVDQGYLTYFFTRVTDMSNEKMTLVMYADSSILKAASPDTVRMTIKRHLDDPGYFRDTFHFRKVFTFTPCLLSTDTAKRLDQDIRRPHTHTHSH